MPRMRYQPEQFGPHMGAILAAPGEVVFGWDELCWAAITVGRRNWRDVIQHGTYSVLEALWRVAMLRANLVQGPDDALHPSRAFQALDRSEKGAVSFFLGLCFSKLLADRLFDVPWLLHLDVYRDRLNPSFALPQRPDFVGTNGADEWVIVESKGRSWNTSSKLLETAKRQTRSLRRINGALPVLRVAIATSFSRWGMIAVIRDPEDFDDDAEDLDITPEALAREYYRPVIEYLEGTTTERSSHADGRPYIRSRLAGMDGWVGVDVDVWEWHHGRHGWDQIAHGRTAVRPSILTEALARRSDRPADTEALADHARLMKGREPSLDGVTIELGDSWREELMRREPGERA